MRLDTFMLSALLRSGDVKNYTALGQDGVPVYSVATQLRETIKFRVRDANDRLLGKKFANYLAIPKRNDLGNTIDWYVPFESDRIDGRYIIIPWTAATDEERRQAFEELSIFERSMLQFGLDLKNNDNLQGDLLQFSRLLCGSENSNDINDPDNLKALRFPSPEYVYLVNNRPVITFWGFVEKNTNVYGHPFLSLKPAQPTISPQQVTSPPITSIIEEKKKPWWRWLLCLLPFLLLGLGCLLFLRYCSSPNISVNLPEVSLPKTDITSELEYNICFNNRVYQFKNGKWFSIDGKLIEDIQLISLLEKINDKNIENCANISFDRNEILRDRAVLTEPVIPSTGVAGDMTTNGAKDKIIEDNPATNNLDTIPTENKDQIPLESQDNINNPELLSDTKEPAIKNLDNQDKLDNTDQIAPQDLLGSQEQDNSKDKALQLPNDNSGSLDFLNGEWSAGSGIQDKHTGKPLRLKYQFEDGLGQVQVERGDGIQCVGDVKASLQGKLLNIGNTGIAKCTDGSTYQLPQVSCKPDTSGRADCSGEYGKGQKFPISMKSN